MDQSQSKETIFIRLPPGLKEKLRQAAKAERRSMSNYIVIVLEKSLTQQEQQHEQ